MTTEMGRELSFDEVKRNMFNKTFVIDIAALKSKDGAIINGAFTFLSTITNFTLGKVYYVSSMNEDTRDLSRWIDRWKISSQQLFILPQVCGSDKPVLKLLSGLSASDGCSLIVLTKSSMFAKSITKEHIPVFKVMKVDLKKLDFNYHKVWFQFHDPEFWNVKQHDRK